MPSSWYGYGWNGTLTCLPANSLLERRLQQVEQPILEQDRVGRRQQADALRLRGGGVVGARSAAAAVRPGIGFGGCGGGTRLAGGAGNFQPSVVTVELELAERPDPRRVGQQPGLADAGGQRRVEARQRSERRPSAGKSTQRDVDRSPSSGGTAGSPPSCGPRRSPRGCGRTARPGPAPRPAARTAPRAAATSSGKSGWAQQRPATAGGRTRSAASTGRVAGSPAAATQTTGTSTPRRRPRAATCRSAISCGRRGGLVDERLADQVAADVVGQRVAVEDLLHAVRLHGRAQPELQRPAPEVGDEVAAEVAARLRAGRSGSRGAAAAQRRGGHGGVLAVVGLAGAHHGDVRSAPQLRAASRRDFTARLHPTLPGMATVAAVGGHVACYNRSDLASRIREAIDRTIDRNRPSTCDGS